jgi:GT2 family glycosyltransferase
MSESRPGRVLFWSSLGVVGYTYVGFPLLVAARALIAPRPIAAGPDLPSVTMIVAAHNEAAVIGEKIDNALAVDYPPELLQVVVASDGSDDDTNRIVRARAGGRLRLLELPRAGKNATLNAAVALADGDILLFTDADTMLDPGALRRLVRPFCDPEVGGVGGDYRHANAVEGADGERAYWDFDRRLRRLQSRSWSMTSAGGGIFAIRRGLFRPIPAGVADDFFTSVQAPAAGLRLVFEAGAVARGPLAASSGAEFRRKVRVISTGLRGVLAVRHALDPRTHGFFAVQLATHKALRRLMALPLLALHLGAIRSRRCGRVYAATAAGMTLLGGAAVAGWLTRGSRAGRSKVLSLPFYFGMVNAASVVAVREALRGDRNDVWVPERAPQDEGVSQEIAR